MSTVIKTKAKNGRVVTYCIADGARGKQAYRELKRQCSLGATVEHSDLHTEMEQSFGSGGTPRRQHAAE